jgi:hypothetical protein
MTKKNLVKNKYFLAFLLLGAALTSGSSPSVAQDNGPGGGGGSGTCTRCTFDKFAKTYECEKAFGAGMSECTTWIVPGGNVCREGGEPCGFFFPSPTPVIL